MQLMLMIYSLICTQWAINNNMKFNNTKFELIKYGFDNDVKQTATYHAPDRTKILSKSQVKDLGVIMSDDGRFSTSTKSANPQKTCVPGFCQRSNHAPWTS